ncbi:uncharacterized protein LOC113464518 [Ceratina calcarata]|uniref:Uncharacterized protein LOC113464518 n=1 Tax=Ceratina calcarata TaxID=156304 RepID=A0AAJ7S4H5_9HYME|nr:uncharacterized protein LOC113464518 [Ceratina calcarata]
MARYKNGRDSHRERSAQKRERTRKRPKNKQDGTTTPRNTARAMKKETGGDRAPRTAINTGNELQEGNSRPPETSVKTGNHELTTPENKKSPELSKNNRTRGLPGDQADARRMRGLQGRTGNMSRTIHGSKDSERGSDPTPKIRGIPQRKRGHNSDMQDNIHGRLVGESSKAYKNAKRRQTEGRRRDNARGRNVKLRRYRKKRVKVGCFKGAQWPAERIGHLRRLETPDGMKERFVRHGRARRRQRYTV